MSIEERLKDYINSRFTNVTDFCTKCGIPSSTMFTVFKRGIHNSSSQTVLKICKALSIDAQSLYDGKIVELERPEQESEDILMYIEKMRDLDLTYKGKSLSDQQKRLIAYATRLSLMMQIKDPDHNEEP